jgi:AbrB family looped-hinge helix DNA binding protein
MSLVRVKSKSQITLPVGARRALGIGEGDYLDVRVDGNKVILVPQAIADKQPQVTLSAQGEAMLDEALEDVKAGRARQHADVDSLLRELHDAAAQG